MEVDEVLDDGDNDATLRHLFEAVNLVLAGLRAVQQIRTEHRRQVRRVHLVARQLLVVMTTKTHYTSKMKYQER